MKKFLVTGMIAAAALLSSCSVTTPLAISEAPIGNKTGTSSTVVLFGIHTNKEYGIAEAAKNGMIKGGVGIADIQVKNYLLFVKKTIIVHGN